MAIEKSKVKDTILFSVFIQHLTFKIQHKFNC